MNARPERRRQPGHHPPPPAQDGAPGRSARGHAQRLAARFAVMAQHHAGKTTRQPRRRRPRIGQPPRVGEQPERQARASARQRPVPRRSRASIAVGPRYVAASRAICASVRHVDERHVIADSWWPIMSKRKHAIEAYFQSGAPAARFRPAPAGRTGLPADHRLLRPDMPTACICWVSSPRNAASRRRRVTCIDQAIAFKPSAAMYHVNRASALLALGSWTPRRMACRTALQLQAQLRGSLPGDGTRR